MIVLEGGGGRLRFGSDRRLQPPAGIWLPVREARRRPHAKSCPASARSCRHGRPGKPASTFAQTGLGGGRISAAGPGFVGQQRAAVRDRAVRVDRQDLLGVTARLLALAQMSVPGGQEPVRLGSIANLLERPIANPLLDDETVSHSAKIAPQERPRHRGPARSSTRPADGPRPWCHDASRGSAPRIQAGHGARLVSQLPPPTRRRVLGMCGRRAAGSRSGPAGP